MTMPYVKVFFSLGGQKIFSLVASLLISIALARALGPESYGVYIFVSAFIPLAALPISGGLPQLLTREIAKHIYNRAYAEYSGSVKTALKLNLWVTVIVFGISALGLLYYEESSKPYLIALALLSIPFIGVEAAHNGFIKGLQNPGRAEFSKQVLQPTLTGLLLLALIGAERLTTSTAILSVITASAGAALCSVLFYRNLRPKMPNNITPILNDRRLFSSLASFSAIALITNFNTQIGILILGTLDLNADAASLRIAERAGQLVALPLAIVNLIIAPRIVTAFQNEDINRLRKLAQRAAVVSFGLTLPATLTLLFYGDWLIAISFGDSYVEKALPAVIIVAIGQTLGAFVGAVWPLLTMTGHEKRALGGLGLAFALNTLLCFWLAPSMGATGAALGSAASLIACKFIFSREIKKLLSVNSRVF